MRGCECVDVWMCGSVEVSGCLIGDVEVAEPGFYGLPFPFGGRIPILPIALSDDMGHGGAGNSTFPTSPRLPLASHWVHDLTIP